MNPERWARVREVFDRAAEADPVGRGALLAGLCAGDEELRREVESLFGAASRAETFLETPLDPEALAPPEPPPALPERIGPYRLLGEIGSGGMGTVYRAQREDFPKTVALKVVRSSLDGALLRRRFRHERAILAGLEHPGIARLYDGGTGEDGRPYLVMELVEGLPLLEHAEARQLDTAGRVALFVEVCSAVAFAHERGVLHRDLKPGNVLVDSGGTPKLLDFGVAKLLDPSGDGAEPTVTVAPLMTPVYASPEQARGQPLGPASDVYALGVVLYELLTGRRPAQRSGSTATDPDPPSTAVSRSGTASTAPSLRRRLQGDLDAIVLKALRADPGDRYPSVAALAEDLRRHLAGLPVAARRGSWRYRAGRLVARHRATAAALGLGLLALGAGFGLARLGGWPGGRSAMAGLPGGAVAVLGFDSLSGRPQDEWIAAVLTETLRTELAAGGQQRVIPAGNVAQALTDLGLSRFGGVGGETLAALHRRLGADRVVLGSFLAAGGPGAPLRVDVRVQAAPGGEPLAEVTETAPAERILDLIARTGFELRSRLGFAALSPGQAQELVASRLADPEAARLYAEGLRAFRDFEIARARSLLEATVARAPDFAPAHFELATVLMRQGFTERASALAERAAELARALPRSEQLRFAGRRAQWNGDWEAAIATATELLALDPQDLEAGLALGQAQIAARRRPEAHVTLAALRKLPPPLSDDPRIDLMDARISRGTPAGVAASERALAKAQALSAHLLVARARFAEGAQHWDSPQIEQVFPPFERALALAEAGGDVEFALNVRMQIGMARWRAGDVTAGEREVGEVVAAVKADELPNLRREALDFLGAMLLSRLELSQSRPCHEQALELAREMGGEDAVHYHSARLGVIEHLTGHSASGRRRLEEAREGLEQLESEFFREDVANALGRLLVETGELDLAQQLAEGAAHAELQAVHEKVLSAESLWLQGMILLARERPHEAEEKLEAARGLLDASSMRHHAAEIRLSLAAAALAGGDAERAEGLAREGTAALRPWSVLAPMAPSTSAVLARALLAQGRLDEARQAFEPVAKAAAVSESVLHRLEVAIDGAALRAAGGERASAAEELRRVVAQAERIGYAATAVRARQMLTTLGAAPEPGRERSPRP